MKIFAAVLSVLIALAAPVRAAGLAEESLGLPVSFSSFGGGPSVTLETLIVRPDEVCSPDKLVGAFEAFGRTSHIPMLWVYAENDHFFGPALARRFQTAFSKAGGHVEFI